MGRSSEYLTRNLFGGEPPERGEEGYLEPGFHFDSDGNIVDETGNVYDEKYNLVKEAPSEGLQMARREHPGRSDQELASLAKIYQRQIEKNRANPQDKKKK